MRLRTSQASSLLVAQVAVLATAVNQLCVFVVVEKVPVLHVHNQCSETAE